MAFNFFHFIGGFGDQGDDPTRDDRSGVLGFLQSTGEGIAHSAERLVKTPASFVSQGARGVYGFGAAGVKAATGDTAGAEEELRKLQESQKNSYINQEYGSKSKGDTSGLGHAAGFGLDVATLGAGSVGKSAAKEAVSPAFNFLEKKVGALGAKVATEAGKGAALGSAYGVSNALSENAKTPDEFAKQIAIGAGFGAAGGAAVPLVGQALKSGARKAPATTAFADGPPDVPAPQAPVDVRNMNRNANVNSTTRTREQVLNGELEDNRLTNPKKLQQAKDYAANQLPEDATPDTTVKVYRAAEPGKPVQPGDFVSLTEAGAKKYTERTPGLEVVSQDVSLGDLVHGNGLKNEYVVAPRATPTSALEELSQKMVSGVPDKNEVAVNVTDIPTPGAKSKLASKAESVYSKLTRGDNLSARLLKIRQATGNRYAPLDDFSRSYERLTGTTLTPENDPGVRAALAAGAPDKIKLEIDKLDNIVRSSGVDPEAVKQLGVLRQMATDRSGIKNPLSPERVSRAMAELEAKLGTEKFAEAEKAVQAVINQNHEILRTAGEFLGKDTVDRIIGANANHFTKFDKLEALIDGQEQIKVGGSFNHASQTAVQGVKEGFEGAMADPFESLIRQWGKIIAFNETNKVGQAMGRMADQLEKAAPDSGLAIKTRTAENVAERMKLYKENKLFKPVRDTLEKAASRSGKISRTLVREMTAIDKTIAKKTLQFQADQIERGKKLIERDVTRGVKGTPEVAMRQRSATAPKSSLDNTDALAAVQGLSDGDVKEILGDVLNWDDVKFTRLENKLRGRSEKLDGVLDDLQLARDQAAGITERMKGNREQAKLLGDKPTPEGYETVAYFRNGIKEEIAVPKDVADAMKNMNAKQADFITKVASFQTKALRAGATALNVAFTGPNAIRDIQTAMVTSENQAAHEVIKNWLRGFGHAWKNDDLVKEFLASGGGQSGFYDRGSANIAQAAKRIGETQAQKVGRTIKSPAELAKLPFKALTKVASSAEQATRLAEFEAAKKNGLSGEAAAHAGRNVSVDFNRAGTLGQIANQWVPFLNANLQGTINTGKAIRRDPARAAAVIGTTVVAPTVATYLWNQENYPDVYAQIPDYVKQNSFVIVYGDEKDENGNFTQVAKIPKGPVGKLFGNPLENLLDYAFQNNPESLSQIAVDTASTISPISFARDGQIDPGLAVSSVLPPAVRGTVENAANFNFFRGAPVVSEKLSQLPNQEQYTDSTSPVARGFGAVTGASPLKVDNFIQAVGGGLGQQIADPKKFVTAPGKTFSGASGNEVENKFYATLDKTKPLRASASKKINEAIKAGDMDKARELADEYNSKLRSNFANFKENYGHLANDDLKDMYSKQKISLTRATIRQRTAAMKAAQKKLARQQNGV